MNRSSKARVVAKSRAIRRPQATPSRGPLRIALEPRMLFDGAAIATAVARLGPLADSQPIGGGGFVAHSEGNPYEVHTHASDPAANDGVAGPDVRPAHETFTDRPHVGLQDALASLPPVEIGSGSVSAATHTVVFIDAGLAHVDRLVAAVPQGAQVVMLDPNRDGLQQVVAALSDRTDVDALHFLTHGHVGEIEIGNTVLNTASITADKDGLLAAIGTHLRAGADVLVYGCDFGAGAEGAAAMQALAHALGADIAASDNATGSAALHGDWVLEDHVGAIHTPAIDGAAWDGLLLGLPIVATPDVAVMPINGSIDIDAVANDIDLNGSAITLTGATALHGAVSINGNNTLHYTPTAGYFGIDTISYTVRDGVGATSVLPGLVTVTINPLMLPTLPIFQEDTPIVFASLLGTQISLGNLNGGLAHLTLSVASGGLTLPTTAGVTLGQGTGSNDATVTIDGPVANVNAVLNGLIYTPATDYNGSLNLSIALPNLLGITVTTLLPISIAPVADVVPDFVHTLSGQSTTFNVLANDTFENAGRTVTAHTSPTHGTLTIDAQGQSTYTPTLGYFGADSFTYTVTSHGTTETATVSILIGNHAPTAGTIGAQSFNDAQTISIAAGAGFADVDGDTLTYSATGLPSGLSINATTGVISGQVNGHASAAVAGGNYAVVVTANDGFGGSVASNFQIHVANPAPIAVDDGAVGVNTTVVVGNVLLNDHDPDGDALTVSTTPVVAPLHGTLALNADGSYVYTPSPIFVGTDSFVYRVTDADGGSATATVAIVVAAPINHLPVAVADLAFVNAGGSVVVNVLANDTDADGDALAVTGAAALHGSVTRNADGTVTYTPTVGFSGIDTITYQVADSHGAAALLSGTVAVTVNAAPTLTLPNLNPLYEDTPVVFASVLGTQITIGDIDGNLARVTLSVPTGVLTLSQTTGLTLSQGSGTSDTTVTFQGTIAAVNAALNGLVYTPAADYNGPVTLTIGLTDGFLNIPITTQLPLDIQPVADIVADSVSTTTGHAVSFNVLANDTFENAGRVVSGHTAPSHGSIAIDAQGNASYTPVAGYVGTDTFNYTVTSNGTTETASVTVNISAPVNHAPTATVIGNVAANDAQAVSINVGGAFVDIDGDTLGYTASGLPAGLSIDAATGVISGTLGGHASVAVPGGTYTVLVTANDGHGGTVSQSFRLDVANPAPIAIADAGSGVNNGVVTGNVLANDSDPDGDALTVNTTPVVAPAHGTVVLNANGSYTYTPLPGYVGSDSFTYRVADTDGGSATAVVSLTIAAPNHAPVANADVAFVNANHSVVVNVLANDTDPDGDALTVTGASAAHGTVAINPDGTLSYTPNVDFFGADTIAYTIRDSHGLASLLAGTVAVSVNATPSIQIPTIPVFAEDTPIVFASALGTQITVGNVLGDVANVTLSVPVGSFTLAQTAGLSFSHGTGTNDTTVTFRGTTAAVNAALNGLVYTPGADYNGAVNFGIGVTDDVAHLPSNVTLPLAIAPVADIVADSVTTTTGHNVAFNVLANDTFENAGRIVSSYTAPSHGSVTIDAQGNASYNPTAGYSGSDTFTYTVTSNGTTETATVTVTINTPLNHAPTVGPIGDVAGTDAQAVRIDAGSAFADADGDPLAFAATGLPAGLSIDATTGVISGTLGGHASTAVPSGVYDIVVSANDGHGGSVSQTIHLNVANPAPIANDDNAVGFNTSVVHGNVLTNDSDPDGDALTVSTTPVVAPTHGTVVLAADGSYAYTSAPGFAGSDSFTYRVTDADGGTATATVHIVVATPVDNLPIAAADSAFVNAGSSTTIDVLGNDSDPNGDALGVSHASALHGTVSINPDGTLHYTPTAGYSGSDTIRYGLTDSQGNNALVDGTVTVTVNALPTVQLPTLGVLYEDTPIVFSSALGTQLSVGDIDGNVAEVSLSVPLGRLTLSQTTGLSFSQGTGTNDTVVTFRGTIADVNAALNGLVYAPRADYNGPVTLTIGITDTLLATPITTQLPLNITAVADIVADGVTTTAGHGVGFNVLANDTFENAGRVLSGHTSPTHGTVSIDAQGNAIYTPTNGFSGTDAFDYTVTSGGTTETTTVTITVNHTPPTATAIADVAANDAQTISVNAYASFHDSDGNALTYSAAGLPAGLAIDASTGVISGTLGGHDSTAVAGGIYAVTVTADDGQGGSVAQTFRITVANPAPVATDDSGSGNENGSIGGNVLANDHDPDGDALAVGTTPVVAPTHGALVLHTDGSYVYTPQAGYSGTDSFVYRVTDADGGSATATVTLTIAAIDHAPTSTPLADRNDTVGNAVSVSEASHFSDIDGDVLIYSATGLPPGLSIDAYTGVISGTLTTVGSYHVTVTGTDPSGLATSQSFDWSAAAAANRAPVVAGALAADAGNDASPVTIVTASGFSDPDGDPLTYAATGLPPGLSIDATTGVISGTLGGHASVGGTNGATTGVYTIVVTASDARGGSIAQGFTFTASNPSPIAVGDAGSGHEDGTIAGNVLANDHDPDGDALSVATTPVVAPTHGALVLNVDGSYVYTPQPGFSGSDSFTYRLVDADGGSALATVSLTVQAIDHAPTSTALADQANAVGIAVSVPEASHFTDVDGDALAYSATGLPPGLSIDAATGVISGTLTTVGSYHVTVTGTDPSGLSTSQSFTWNATVNTNNSPNTVGVLPAGSADDAAPVSIATAAAFRDPDGDPLTFRATGLPAGLFIDATTGVIGGTLDGHASVGGVNGVYTIVVTADDGHGGTAVQGFRFTASNPAPIAQDDAANGLQGGTIAGNVLANDHDPDGDALAVGTEAVVLPAHGTLVLHANGSYVYTPQSGFRGTDSFTYRLVDADGGMATATVTLTVAAVEHAPTSTQPADQTNTLQTTVSVSEAAHFADVDGDALTFTATGLPPGLSIDAQTGVITGTLTTLGTYSVTLTATDPSGLSTSQSFQWTTTTSGNNSPNTVGALAATGGNDATAVNLSTAGGFADPDGNALTYSASGLPAGLSIDAVTGVIGGTLDGHASVGGTNGVYAIVVTASDGQGGTAVQGFRFTAVNPAPVAVADVGSGVENGPVTGNVLANDRDPDGDALTVATSPVVAPAHGTLVLNADGSYVYTPQAGFHGTDGFTYRLVDADGGTATATVTLTVAAVNDAPTSTPLANQSNTVGTMVSVSEAAHFADADGDPLAFTVTGLPPGLSLDPATGVISGIPTTAGSYDVTLTATDPSGASTSQSFHWITTAGALQGPIVVGPIAPASGMDAGVVTIATAAAFGDPAGLPLTFSATGLPPGLSIDATTGVIGGTLDGHASVGGTNGGAGGVYTIVVTASDGRGNDATQGFTFTATNPAPIATADVAAGVEDGTIGGNVLTNDRDPDGDALSVVTTPVAGPAHGTLVLNADGSYVYTPQADFHGTDRFTYRVVDADGGTATATVTFTVASVNDAPTATPLADQSHAVGTPVSTAAGASFHDVDGDPLVFTASGLPPGLSIDPATGVISGTLTTAGTYRVTVTGTDPSGADVSRTFEWNATVPNLAPVTVGPVASTMGNDSTAIAIPTAAAFQDPNGDPLTYSATGLPPGLSIDPATGVIGGTLDSHASTGAPGGVYTIVVTANDGHGGIVSQGFTFTATNPPPIAPAAADAVIGSGTISGNLLVGVVDPDGDALRVDLSPVVPPSHGTVVVNADGSYVYTPEAGYTGSDRFTFRVVDADGQGVQVTVNVVVQADATPPIVAAPPAVAPPIAVAPPVASQPTSPTVVPPPPAVTSDGGAVDAVSPTPMVEAGTPVAVDPTLDLAGQGAADRALDTDSQREAQLSTYEPVLLKAINEVKRLEGNSNLSSTLPLNASVNALALLGAQTEIVNGVNPMEQVVGDLSSGFRTPVVVGGPVIAGGGADVPLLPAALSSDPTLGGLVPGEEPPLADASEVVGKTLNFFSDRSITLTAQLRLASLEAQRELTALADAVT